MGADSRQASAQSDAFYQRFQYKSRRNSNVDMDFGGCHCMHALRAGTWRIRFFNASKFFLCCYSKSFSKHLSTFMYWLGPK